jgi:hypothetical protein
LCPGHMGFNTCPHPNTQAEAKELSMVLQSVIMDFTDCKHWFCR